MKQPLRAALTLPFFVGCVLNAQVSAPLAGFAPKQEELPANVFRITRRRTAVVYRFADEKRDHLVKVIYRRKGRDYLRFFHNYQTSREFRSALDLVEIGIRVPEPKACYRNWNLFSKVDSIFVAEYMDGLQPGKIFLRPDLTSPEIRSVFVSKYADGMRRMLSAGLLNVDAHPGNVLWSGNPDDDLVWIDNDVERFPPEEHAWARRKILDLLEWKIRRDESGLTFEELEEIAWII